MAYNVLLVSVAGSRRQAAASELIRRLGWEPTIQPAVYRDQTPARFPAAIRTTADRVRAGEWGCSIAHHDCWRRVCAEQTPAIIFEDDIAISVDDATARGLIDRTLELHAAKDVVFLGYWGLLTTHAYYVTPAGAATLLRGADVDAHRIPVPVDHHIKRLCETGRVTHALAPNTPNTPATEFDGVVKQVSTRRKGGGTRQRFLDVR